MILSSKMKASDMKGSKKMKGALAVSLAINLFFFAAIGGAVVRWVILEWLMRDLSGQQHYGMRYVVDALPSDQSDALRGALRTARNDSRNDVQTAREGRRELAHLLAAPVFNARDAEAAAARTRTADMAIRARVENAVIDYASTLSSPQRHTLAEALIQRGPLHVSADAPAASVRQAAGDAHDRNP
ncbi:periplasmic heavy metal sensor [Sodalis sp. dw_96]|uniref:periplasmic heavy metal sensor n=1 Tax=Sodalis sp. dw_96 TaxID=2719794 RepID=UPI001BD249A7|nr:periplasmic heavy metal sensor [Sodalis sp. dw_96]